MLTIDFIAWALFTYLALFILYRIVIIFNSSRGRMADVKKRDYQPQIDRKLTVLIYSHNNSIKAKSLIESFAKQTYDKEKFSVNVILDNCDAESIKLLEIKGGARLWRINTDVKPIGKYKAYAWLLERIRAFENTNAFVFLDAECLIKSDFLEKINANLNEEAVIVGETIKRKKYFLNKLVNVHNKITNRVIRHGRYYSGLGNVIDADVMVIKQQILEKIGFESMEQGFEEYEYSVKLRYFNIPVIYSSEITVFKNIKESVKSIALSDYKKRYRSFKTFLNNSGLLFTRCRLSAKEQIISLIYPSGPVFVFWSLVLIGISLIYGNTHFAKTININILAILVFSRLVTDLQALISMRTNILDYYHVFLLNLISPAIYLRSMLTGFITLSEKAEKKEKQKAVSTSFEKTTVEATITNGKSEFPCFLEIIKSDENSSVTFTFKDKNLKSSKQPRVCYAVEEIVSKLKSHGFSLKICANCGYFHLTESTAAHTDGEQGYCLYRNYKENSKEKDFTPAWSSCKKIIPRQAGNYIRQEIGLDKK